jgi:ribosomal protein S18 acetylase RimI-like enzyme
VAVTARAFQRPDDLRLLLELEQELWRTSPDDVVCTFGQIAFWSAQLLHDDWAGRLWFDGEQLAGWGWLTGGTELELQVRPTQRELVDEILDWANPTELLVDERDSYLIACLNARGLVHLPAGISMIENARSLEEIEEPRVPDGYRLTTMAEYEDTASRSAAHRAAFSPSRFTDEVYAVVRKTWPYRADLDCVAVAPDDSVASYTLAWLDEENGGGVVGPGGTHEAHQRKGLGRAVNLFALQRLRDEGAKKALVACRADDARPIPRKLYESVGFREVERFVSFGPPPD